MSYFAIDAAFVNETFMSLRPFALSLGNRPSQPPLNALSKNRAGK
jgi:hypothetical protein